MISTWNEARNPEEEEEDRDSDVYRRFGAEAKRNESGGE